MITLNEQIQRLRDVLVTCYNAIKRKGGTIPEEGERNMTNLPAAVASIPQEHSELVDLEVTANGEYLPATYDADGFSKVTARFDTSSLPKVKVDKVLINNNCIDENGVWDGRLLDVSGATQIYFGGNAMDMSNLIKADITGWDTKNVSTFWYTFINLKSLIEIIGHEELDFSNATQVANLFYGCYSLKRIDGGKWRFPKVKQDGYGMFRFCRNLEYLNVNGWDTSKFTDLHEMFQECQKLTSLDLTSWSLESATNVNLMLWNLRSLETFVGGRTIDDVISNNITALRGLKISLNMGDPNQPNIDRASLRALINGLADLTGQTTQTLTLGATLMAKLTEEDIAIATSKNWSIS